jgi:hypothetical protein
MDASFRDDGIVWIVGFEENSRLALFDSSSSLRFGREITSSELDFLQMGISEGMTLVLLLRIDTDKIAVFVL